MAATFATTSIISLWDLDVQSAEYLHSFNVPPLKSVLPTPTVAPSQPSSGDPNEVDLDIEAPSESSAVSAVHSDTHSFESYGVGRLLYHSLVWRYFARITQYESSDKEYLCSEDMLQYLLDYQTLKKSQSGHNRKFNDFNVQDFISFVCTALEISDLIEVGVVIQGNLQAERVALEQVVNYRYKLFVEVTKRELNHFNQQMQSYQEDGRRTAKKRRKRDTMEETMETPLAEPEIDQGEGDGPQDHMAVESAAIVANVEGHLQPGLDMEGLDEDTKEEQGVGACKKVAVVVSAESESALLQPQELLTAASTSTHTHNETKYVHTQSFESSLTVYLPTGQPSVSHISAAYQDHSTIDAINSGIYVIENWELQPVLPFVSAAMANMTNSTSTTMNTPTPPPPLTPIQQGNGVYVSTIHNTGSSYGASCSNVNINVMDSQAVGRWGEALVYQYLLHSSPLGSVVNWLNQDEESRACYDFILHAPSGSQVSAARASRAHHNTHATNHLNQPNEIGIAQCSAGLTSSSLPPPPATVVSSGRHSTEYIEVKSTRYSNRNVFEISPNEWQFAAADSRVPYHVFRVFSAGDASNVKIVVIRDVLSRITEGRVKICLAI